VAEYAAFEAPQVLNIDALYTSLTYFGGRINRLEPIWLYFHCMVGKCVYLEIFGGFCSLLVATLMHCHIESETYYYM